MQELITYDSQGTGENYGVQYHGEDLVKLIKAIHHLVHTKGIPLPLPSHHGLVIKLKKFNDLRLCILALNWTHGNKGNGKLVPRIYLKDIEWNYTINENGDCIGINGIFLGSKVKIGFIKMLEKAGFKIGEADTESRAGVYVNLADEIEFLSHIMLSPSGEEVRNPDYERAFGTFIGSIQEIFCNYELLR
jgi:hypothetical protein